jgi:hypothetical protein
VNNHPRIGVFVMSGNLGKWDDTETLVSHNRRGFDVEGHHGKVIILAWHLHASPSGSGERLDVTQLSSSLHANRLSPEPDRHAYILLHVYVAFLPIVIC